MKISGQPLKHLTCAQHQQLGFLWVYEKAVITAPACDFFKVIVHLLNHITSLSNRKGITWNHQHMIPENTRLI